MHLTSSVVELGILFFAKERARVLLSVQCDEDPRASLLFGSVYYRGISVAAVYAADSLQIYYGVFNYTLC